MAISHVQQFGAFAVGSPISATTGNVTVTAGNALIVGVLGFNIGGGQTASASDTLGNTWNTAVGPFQGTIAGSTSLMYVFYVKKLNASGTTAVTITFSAASNNIRVHCHEVSGLDQTSPFDQMNTNTATSAAMTSGNVTTLFANEFLYGYGADNSGNPTTGVGWTPGITEGSELDEWQIVSATGTYAATYTGDGAAYMCEIATFKAAQTTWGISGNAGTPGATVSWTGTSSGSVTADGAGNYNTGEVLANGPYTITPSKTGFTFTPTSSSQTVSGADITNVNFTATPVSAYYSVPDSRAVTAITPNSSRTVQGTKIYDVPKAFSLQYWFDTLFNRTQPLPVDSRAQGAPVDSRAAGQAPQNSRTPGTYGPGVN
jgi:hypothetical protein